MATTQDPRLITGPRFWYNTTIFKIDEECNEFLICGLFDVFFVCHWWSSLPILSMLVSSKLSVLLPAFHDGLIGQLFCKFLTLLFVGLVSLALVVVCTTAFVLALVTG
jgi:hypothetical protein